MLGVVKTALNEALSNDALNIFITFSTKSKGVMISNELKTKYPDQMSIVLQNQFSELKVLDDLFSVCLSFSGKLEYIKVPFSSIAYFLDRECNFGLEFQPSDEDMQEDDLPEKKTGAKIVDISDMIKKNEGRL